MAGPADYRQAVDQFADWRWRLNNLYWITDKAGTRVPFQMNWAQEALFDDMHYLNAILKARQLGFTTFIQLFMLDACVFNSNIRAGTIAHTLPDAEAIFKDKVKYPYENLPDGLKAANPAIEDSARVLSFANNSSIRVGTSLRSGTLQYLHISEYGKICAHYPEKAREIRTGALNTLQAGQVAWIESTAEGQEGDFFELCERSQAMARSGSKLTELDFKFHFFPWWKHPEYSMDPKGVDIPQGMAEYFGKLKADHGINLNAGQKAWYAKKAAQQEDDIKREFPSTPKEAFEAAIEGAYYADHLAKAEADKRITRVPYEPLVPVQTYWDLGIDDTMAIWFAQFVGKEFRIIDYYENSGEGLPFYVNILNQRGYTYGSDYLPHDGAARELGTGKTRQETLQSLNRKVEIVPRHEPSDGINAVRLIIPRCWFDKEKCDDGLKALKSYRREWDEDRGTWKSQPRHDWASHPADAFRTLAMAGAPKGKSDKIKYPKRSYA